MYFETFLATYDPKIDACTSVLTDFTEASE